MIKAAKKHINLVKTYAAVVEKSGIPVSAAYIFGSRVHGTAHKWSDLDTCIVSPRFGRSRLREGAKLTLLSSRISGLIEPHPFSPEDFNDPREPLAVEIKRTGVRVV